MVDVEALVATWIEANVDNIRGMSETPANLDALVPVAKVRRVGGPYDGFKADRATVDIDVFDSTRDGAIAAALHVQWALHHRFDRSKVGDAVVCRVETLTSPRPLPYDNTGLRRFGATYRITVHSA
ncbi:hypothetical protein Sme01_02860 [Sphaerisporangium melleum]|uniref:Tail terminator n=1 Tax=Sphaerisporangium melleum TaxID=321316 RepID=A0A917QP85_9ACTN|nr:hypothetical protein [Sphaerisporangium melleum]GGK61218.1 hypothetical protein GCM10007964_00400 [Sphaerisporangium melleum]GII67810.1 hypothetical protein Sme01_02860 [Sphaerisporangium melleum]